MKKSLFAVAMALVCPIASARITPGPLVGDSMVLQQNSESRIWGWTDNPGASVTLRTSWSRGRQKTTAGPDGRWEFTLSVPEATFEPQTMVISDGEKLTINDILIGEVWLASGQSNMEQPLRGFDGCPVENSAEYIAEAGNYRDRVHFCTVAWEPSPVPKETVGTVWHNCEPGTAGDFCAVAYFFGIRLTEALGCPVGLINSSVGATTVEGWTHPDIVAQYPDIRLDSEEILNCDKVEPAENVERSLPVVFYNGMIHPIEGYGIKGFLWYQGEANVDRPDTYAERFAAMVRDWRGRWGLGDLPFYYVEICPFDYWWVKDKATVPLLREAQYLAQDMLPNMGMVCTNDLVKDYEYYQIHPCMKKEVGDRLCYWALGETYGVKGIECRYPEFREMTVKGREAILSFDNVENGFDRNRGIEGFRICGADSVWHDATVRVNGNELSVTCPAVDSPAAVRYCFDCWCPGTLKSNSGLPVIPFRTDRRPGAPATAGGRICSGSVHSAILGMDVPYNVYLPDGYSAGEHYPIVYLLHGLSDTYTAWDKKGNMKKVADEVIASRRCRPVVIVMPNAGDPDVVNIQSGYFNMPGCSYEDFFFGEFIPAVEARYNAGGSKAERAVMGLSMGGGGSTVYCQRHPDMFSSCYAMSAWLDNEGGLVGPETGGDCLNIVCRSVHENSALEFVRNADEATLEALRSVKWFFDCGDDDFLFDLSAGIHQLMRDREVGSQLRVRDGAHTWQYWNESLRTALPFASANFNCGK